MTRLVSDAAWAVMTLWLEARGESYEGKVAVAEVIRNRMALRYQSDGTLAGTIFRPYQFSCWNGTEAARKHAAVLDDADPLVQDCLHAWEEAQAGSQRANGAVLYLNPIAVPTVPRWADERKHVATIGAHRFYRA